MVEEAIHTAEYNVVVKEAHTINPHNEKAVDELMEKIEIKYRLKRISEEQVQYLTRILCSRS